MLLNQIYTCYLDLDDYAIKISENNHIFHNYDTLGIKAYELLELKEDIISTDELWDYRLNIKNEEYKDNIDYYKKYLEMIIVIIDMVKNYYHYDISIEEAKKIEIEYDDIDELDGIVSACHHIFESAGEKVWNLLEFDKPYIAESSFDSIRRESVKELLNQKYHEKLILKKD